MAFAPLSLAVVGVFRVTAVATVSKVSIGERRRCGDIDRVKKTGVEAGVMDQIAPRLLTMLTPGRSAHTNLTALSETEPSNRMIDAVPNMQVIYNRHVALAGAAGLSR